MTANGKAAFVSNILSFKEFSWKYENGTDRVQVGESACKSSIKIEIAFTSVSLSETIREILVEENSSELGTSV